MPNKEITKNTSFGEVLQINPETAVVFLKHGLHCIGCRMAATETIEQGCKMHGMTDKQIEQLVKELKAVINTLKTKK